MLENYDKLAICIHISSYSLIFAEIRISKSNGMMKNIDDIFLLQRIKEDDEAAFKYLFDKIGRAHV